MGTRHAGRFQSHPLGGHRGNTPIDDALLERLARYGDLHYMLRRGIFYSHRDMISLLDEYDKGNRFVLYTGRGPSGNTHLGHIMPWIFNKWVQDTFGVDMLFQLQGPHARGYREDGV